MDDNIIKFPHPSGNDLEIEYSDEEYGPRVNIPDLLDAAKEREFDDVILIGTWKDSDNFYFASTTGSLSTINWNLDKAKHILLQASLDNMEND